MLKIITDGAVDMPVDWEARFGIHILPLRVNFGNETFTQGPGFTLDDFYRMVREKGIIPKTSLPSIGQVKEFFRSTANQNDTILSINISSKLSGTFSTVQIAAQELADKLKIYVFDSAAGSAAQAFMAREARMLEQAGAGIETILRRLERMRADWTVIFTLDTLDYAYMNGRVSKIQNLVGAALQLKPIIRLRDGLLGISDKVRTRRRSLDLVIQNVQERIGDRMANLAVVHAADPETAQWMIQKILTCINVKEFIITDLSIPVAANLGPGTIGVIAYPVEE